jgi:hypothetical protein
VFADMDLRTSGDCSHWTMILVDGLHRCFSVAFACLLSTLSAFVIDCLLVLYWVVVMVYNRRDLNFDEMNNLHLSMNSTRISLFIIHHVAQNIPSTHCSTPLR